MYSVITIILAGGQGSRLYPLTKFRSKPAVPIAGKFRLIDIPISNCLHSGLRRIFVSTQFSSESLHRHIFLTYRFDHFSKGFVAILSAQQTLENRSWYQGTADAVRKNLTFLKNKGDLVLILSGDHLYRMDYRRFINFHLKTKADISISVYPVPYEEASEFGVMKINKSGRILSFSEKPKTKEELDAMLIHPETFKELGLNPNGNTHLASMGIYVFKWEVLDELLENTDYQDFGKEVIPHAINNYKVYGYLFDGYWEDIGTIRSFFEAHLDLTRPLPKFNFYDEEKPIYTRPRFLPGSKILMSDVEYSILSDGSIINRSRITNSVIGIRSIIGENSVLDRVVMMGADFYEQPEQKAENARKGIPNVGVGSNCEIRNVIIDKNARIGNNVKLINKDGLQNANQVNYYIRDGILIIPKNAVIPDGTVV